jgi:hypothetical protein
MVGSKPWFEAEALRFWRTLPAGASGHPAGDPERSMNTARGLYVASPPLARYGVGKRAPLAGAGYHPQVGFGPLMSTAAATWPHRCIAG